MKITIAWYWECTYRWQPYKWRGSPTHRCNKTDAASSHSQQHYANNVPCFFYVIVNIADHLKWIGCWSSSIVNDSAKYSTVTGLTLAYSLKIAIPARISFISKLYVMSVAVLLHGIQWYQTEQNDNHRTLAITSGTLQTACHSLNSLFI